MACPGKRPTCAKEDYEFNCVWVGYSIDVCKCLLVYNVVQELNFFIGLFSSFLIFLILKVEY